MLHILNVELRSAAVEDFAILPVYENEHDLVKASGAGNVLERTYDE